MQGGEICVPTHLNSVQIWEEIHQRIAEGWYFIGEPCVESVLVRYVDTPAKRFEAGCKRAGKRKCVLCGCLAHLHDDFAYCA